jgi:hypothetical protein
VTAQNADTVRPDLDLAYWAWTLLANVSEGDWTQQTTEWQQAVVRWRDAFHEALGGYGQWGALHAAHEARAAQYDGDGAA